MGSETWRLPGESLIMLGTIATYSYATCKVLLGEKVFVEMQMQAEAYRPDRQEATRSRCAGGEELMWLKDC